MAANSNLLSAGGWRRTAAADVDGDASRLCLGRLFVRGDCADNSSSAVLDIPGRRTCSSTPGSTSRRHCRRHTGRCVSASTVRLTGFTYTEIGPATACSPAARRGIRGVGSVRSDDAPGRVGRDRVRRRRRDRYVHRRRHRQRARRCLHALRVVGDRRRLRARSGRRPGPRGADRPRRSNGSLAVPCRGTTGSSPAPMPRWTCPSTDSSSTPPSPVFAKSFHVVGHAPHRGAENLLFNGKPIGNNAPPGDRGPTGGRDRWGPTRRATASRTS